MGHGSSFGRMLELPWKRRKAAKFSHQNALRRLKSLGFTPNVIYDIGAYRGGWTRLTSEVFPAATFILFEANGDHAPELAKTGHRHFIIALGAEDGDRKPFYVPCQGDVTGASLYIEKTAHYARSNLQVRTIDTARLDTLIATYRFAPPDLIKVDVQGAELDVMAGASLALQSAGAMIVELSLVDYNKGAPLLADVIGAIDRLGFQCIDICEIHRTKTGFVLQLDMLFAKPPLFVKYRAQAGVAP